MVELAPRASASDDPIFRPGFAGDTLNTGWYLRALLPQHCRVRYLTSIGDDENSRRMLAFLAKNGIDTGAIATQPVRTAGLYKISLSAGERAFPYLCLRSAARALADDPDRLTHAMSECKLVSLSGVTLAILPEAGQSTLQEVLTRFRATGGLVAFDPNIRQVLWPDAKTLRTWIARGYATCDISFPTFEDDAALFSDASLKACGQRIAARGTFEVVVKNGAAPVFLHSNGRQSRIPPPTVVTPIGTTAARASLKAGWLSARQKWGLHERSGDRRTCHRREGHSPHGRTHARLRATIS